MSDHLTPLAHLPWALLALASLLLWWPKLRAASLALLAAAGAAGFALGQLDARALIALALLALAGWMIAPTRARAARIGGHALFVLVALALGFHVAPGFHNALAVPPTRITADAIEFSMYLNLDKPLVGFWLLLVWGGAQRARPPVDWFKAALPAGLGAALLCLGIAYVLGLVAWAPKWPAWGTLWALNNLLLVTLAEEALFRGYLQEGLMRRWRERRWGDAAAIAVAAVAFGLVHWAGGWAWALLATAAGAGYGLAYRRGGLQAAMLAHFGLNLIHFTALSYPMLA
ncbi:CPBP family intramembrane metalloprotease [Lysobacter silvisoli]|uniref:CPBP family intramembrane metalloprotease n=1 Tax=Lysobacter silvisoli TaxID=2293254 RepID=A0A371K0X7_9GAMM|nr:CPBP family intramembrane metalloprotease [Lysobacter silvisoli]